jgi:hypothetical protein
MKLRIVKEIIYFLVCLIVAACLISGCSMGGKMFETESRGEGITVHGSGIKIVRKDVAINVNETTKGKIPATAEIRDDRDAKVKGDLQIARIMSPFGKSAGDTLTSDNDTKIDKKGSIVSGGNKEDTITGLIGKKVKKVLLITLLVIGILIIVPAVLSFIPATAPIGAAIFGGYKKVWGVTVGLFKWLFKSRAK